MNNNSIFCLGSYCQKFDFEFAGHFGNLEISFQCQSTSITSRALNFFLMNKSFNISRKFQRGKRFPFNTFVFSPMLVNKVIDNFVFGSIKQLQLGPIFLNNDNKNSL